MELLLSLGKTLVLSWLVTRFEPLQWLINLLPDKKIKFLIQDATTCMKCMSLYLGLMIFGDIYIAALASFLSVIYMKTLGVWEQKVKFN